MANQKKIGDIITMRGQVAEGLSGIELNLFDGDYSTGYKILEFYISPDNVTGSNEIMAVLSTNPATTASTWNWSDVQQVAWASWGISSAASGGDFTLVDFDNMIIENIYLSSTSTVSLSNMNYYMTLQKYKISAWDGALNMVTNLSQGGPLS